MNTAYKYIDAIAALGEGAIWDHKTHRYYWIDIENGNVFIYEPSKGNIKSIPVGQRIGTVVPTTKEDHVLVALQNGIYSLDISTEELKLLAEAPYDPNRIRFNDGKCDPAGRFLVGTMGLASEPDIAALYCYEKGTTPIQILHNVTCSNGLCWSNDKNIMYYIDTPKQWVKAFDYDIFSGAIKNGRIIIDFKDIEGSPDGMTIDSDGNLWIALWGGSSVVCYNPTTSKLVERIPVPAKNVTSCTFGGDDLRTLFITSASIGMHKLDQQTYPHAGAVFAAVPGVTGIKNHFFKW